MIRDGIINLLKPAGMTSHDGIYFLRRLTGIKRIGHTGTLDPMAVGVLPICIGTTARISDYLDLDQKKYRCELILGLETDTQDIWGTVISDRRDEIFALTEEKIREAFEPLMGNIMQTPPIYSALKVNGRRLYDYARKGETVEIQKRPVTIYERKIVNIDLTGGRITFDISCSKGTYIRSICSEIGQTLGTGAAMSSLIRMASGEFSLKQAVTMEQLRDGFGSNPEAFVLPSDFPLTGLGRIQLAEGRGKWFSNGGYLIDQDVNVLKEPFQKEREADQSLFEERLHHLKTRKELLNTYCVYDGSRFLGTTVFQPEKQQYIADKVFKDDSI